ncbi:MAG: hypothetical protein HC875_14915 [Anaerolineales bacterium]|nr:hypothetical protein [Anaerolineales bacterium]
MNAGGRHSRRWLTEAESVQAATGTDGRAAPAIPPVAKKRGLGLMFGHQLRLIK